VDVLAVFDANRLLRDRGFLGLTPTDSFNFCGFSFNVSGSACFAFCVRFRCSWRGDGPFRSIEPFFSLVGSSDTAIDLLFLGGLLCLDVDNDLACLDLELLAFAAAVLLDPTDLDFFGFRFGRDNSSSGCMIGSPSFFDTVLFHSTNCLSTSVVQRV